MIRVWRGQAILILCIALLLLSNMPLWTDLFKGYDKSEPFKPKKSEPTAGDSERECESDDQISSCSRDTPPHSPRNARAVSPLRTPRPQSPRNTRAVSPLRTPRPQSPRNTRAVSPMRTPPSHCSGNTRAVSPLRTPPSHSPRNTRSVSPLRTPPPQRSYSPTTPESGGVKKSSSFRTPPYHDDTIGEIKRTLQSNRQKKSSTPKTPQTPKPPAIHIDPVCAEDRPDQESDTRHRGDMGTPTRVHLDPVTSSESQGEASFSVEWNLDEIMKKSVRDFSESIQMLDACPSNTSHLLSAADTHELLAPSESSEYQDLPDDTKDLPDNNNNNNNTSNKPLDDSNSTPLIVVQEEKKTTNAAVPRDHSPSVEQSRYKAQVDEIEDLWNDLIPLDESLNLADCSFAAMEFSYPTDCNTQEVEAEPKIAHLGLEDTAQETQPEIPHLGLEDTELLPQEYITDPDNITASDHEAHDTLPTDHISPDHMMMDLQSEINLVDSQDLFGLSGDCGEASQPDRDTLLCEESLETVVSAEEQSPHRMVGSTGEQSPHRMVARLLALQATNEALRAEMGRSVPVSCVQELQNILTNKEEEIERQDRELFELHEAREQGEQENKQLNTALQQSREDTKRLNLLNMIHMDNAICRDVAHPTSQDTACSPIPLPGDQDTCNHGDEDIEKIVSRDVVDVGVNTSSDVEQHPHESSITSLLAHLNLEDTRLGNKTFGCEDESLNTTVGAPDLSLFDLTLTTGLSEIPDQTLLINHLSDIQSEAMKIQARSEELCRENEMLHNQVGNLSKDLETERGKVKTRIKELMEEREKCRRLDAQLLANNEQHAKKVEEITKKLAHEEGLKKKNHSTIKANKDLHKKKLEEVFEFHQKELDELTAKKELTEEQAKGLAKLINVEPDKELVSTDCQTSMIFSNFVLHMSTENNGSCTTDTPDNDAESIKQQLIQVEEEYLTLKDHTRTLEDRTRELNEQNKQLEEQSRELEEQTKEAEEIYIRQNQENNALIEMTNREKKEIEEELGKLREAVSESEELMSAVQTVPATLLSNNNQLTTMQLESPSPTKGAGTLESSQHSNDTVNFSRLTNPGEQCALPDATRYLVGVYKTATEQVQELEVTLQNKDNKLNSVMDTNSKLNKQLSETEAELKTLKVKIPDYDDIQDKLLEANRTIAKLKGEILKLSSEAQNALLDTGADDALIEENEELKKQVEKLEEVKEMLMCDVRVGGDQLDEEQDMNDQAAKEIAEANEVIEELKSNQSQLEADLETSTQRNQALDDKVRSLEEQLAELHNQIKQEKDATRQLIERAEDAATSKTKHSKEMEELRGTMSDLQSTIDELRDELRRKTSEMEVLGDDNSSLQRKLNKLQPSLDSYEEENLRLKEQLTSQQEKMLLLKEEIRELEADKDGLGDSVNSSLKQKLKEAKDKASEHEHDADSRERSLRELTNELHECKEELASAEEKVEKLEAALEELRERVNVRKKSASSQAAVSRYEVGSTCNLLDSKLNSELQENNDKLQENNDKLQENCNKLQTNYDKLQENSDKLQSQLEQISTELESNKSLRAELEVQVQQFQLQKSNSDQLALQLQEEHALALDRLRATHTREKEEALETLRLETEADRRRRDESYRQEMETRSLESRKEMEVVIGDMEKKRGQDCSMIARKVGLDPTSLTTVLPDSTQLTDRIEALHNQAVQIRNLALSFYEASHPPTREASVQVIVKMFKCSTQTTESSLSSISQPVKEKQDDSTSLQELIKVFKEEHEKQTEVLLRQLKTEDKQPPSPSNDLTQLKDEVQRLRLSVETYTTRCAILEHNNRLLKDRNTGLENDLMSSAHHSSMIIEDDESQLYNSHVQRSEPRDLRKRLAECQKEMGKLQDTVAEYQNGVEQLELELEREKGERKRSEKRVRAAESAAIEIKNDRILARDEQEDSHNIELSQAKESCRLLATENKKLKSANGKLRNLNNSLLESNRNLKQADSENYVLNVSNKSTSLIQEIDSLKEVEDVRFELGNRETELRRKENRISLLETEIETKSNMIAAQRDELQSREKVIKLIKSELSSQQMDMAELKAMLDVERTRCDQLDRRAKSSDIRQLDDSSAHDELRRLRAEKAELLEERSGTPNSRSRVTRAYLKFLRAESSRKALVFQKQYLLNLLAKAKAVENAALSILEVKQDESSRRKPKFKHAAILVVASIRMKNLVIKWRRVRESLEEKQRRKQTPSRCHSSLTEHRALVSDINYDRSPSPVARISSSTSLHSGYPKWDSSRPLSPPSHPRDGMSGRVYGSPSPDPSLTRLDLQLARLRQTINTRAEYNDHKSDSLRDPSRVSDTAPRVTRVVPERDSGVTKPVLGEDDGTGTLSDISNYISRLEAVQSRLTDLKLSSYKIYDSNRSLS